MNTSGKQKKIEIVAAIAKNLVIGKNGKLPWNIKEDLKHFRDITLNHIVVMGKNTYLSLPSGPLKNRINVVVTSNPEIFKQHDNAIFTKIKDLDEVLDDLSDEFPDKTIFIIGGSQLYKTYLAQSLKLHITYIDKNAEGDVYFPPFFEHTLSEYSEKHYSNDEKCSYQFLTYERSTSQIISNDMRYLKLLYAITNAGNQRDDRTGTGTKSLFARQMRFDIKDHVPLLTTKFVPWKSCIKELLWFLKGQTDSKILQEQGVNIWNGNTTREFLDNRGLTSYPEGDIGCGYGFQWRHFGAEYNTCKDNYTGKGYDQIQYVINELKTNPYSRRIFLSAWNPLHMDKMALPPCHVSVQFYVEQRDSTQLLSCHMYQRSVDSFLGLPFNIFSYTTLTYIIAKICNMTPHELIISTGDTHIYNDHFEQIKTQMMRTPISPPKLVVSDRLKNMDASDIDSITIDDFDIVGYYHHPTLKGNMSV